MTTKSLNEEIVIDMSNSVSLVENPNYGLEPKKLRTVTDPADIKEGETAYLDMSGWKSVYDY